MIRQSDCFCGLVEGLGKTSITLSAINILKYYKWSIRKALVVAPKKVAEGTWSKEASKWSMAVVLYHRISAEFIVSSNLTFGDEIWEES